MYSNMCVKIALCLALIVSIDGYVLKHQTVPLSAEGMTVEITVSNKEDKRHPLTTLRIDINEEDKKVVIATAEAPLGVPNHLSVPPIILPTLESRAGMVLGRCAAGHTFRGRICVPNDY